MFLRHIRIFFAAALGIEILCISAAVIGENSALYFFSYNLQGIVFGYIMGYAAAGFATFMTIIGRYNLNAKIVVALYLNSNRLKGLFRIL